MGIDCTCCPWDLCYCPLNAGRRHTDTHNPRLHAHAHRQPSVCASKRSRMYKITSGCSA